MYRSPSIPLLRISASESVGSWYASRIARTMCAWFPSTEMSSTAPMSTPASLTGVPSQMPSAVGACRLTSYEPVDAFTPSKVKK